MAVLINSDSFFRTLAGIGVLCFLGGIVTAPILLIFAMLRDSRRAWVRRISAFASAHFTVVFLSLSVGGLVLWMPQLISQDRRKKNNDCAQFLASVDRQIESRDWEEALALYRESGSPCSSTKVDGSKIRTRYSLELLGEAAAYLRDGQLQLALNSYRQASRLDDTASTRKGLQELELAARTKSTGVRFELYRKWNGIQLEENFGPFAADFHFTSRDSGPSIIEVSFTADGRLLVLGTSGAIGIVDPEKGTMAQELKARIFGSDYAGGLGALSPERRRVASVSEPFIYGSSEEFVGESGESVAVNPPAPGGGFAPATL